MAYLVLVRHGTSEFNAKGLWTGWLDPELTQEGKKDAELAAHTLKDIHFGNAYASPLIRHKETAEIILHALHQENLPLTIADELKERNYGDFTGKNKWEIKKQLGNEEFMKLRRGWDYPIPHGESLKQLFERVVPYYQKAILPHLLAGNNVLVSSSGNALRSLVKYLEHISNEAIADLEIAPGEVYVYQLDESGNVLSKEIRNQHPNIV